MSTATEYVRTDEQGVMRVGNSKVTLERIVYAFRNGQSPESIHQDYPRLTLEEVYGAITYILAHPQQVDAYIKSQEQLWDRLRAESDKNPSPVMERLRALKREGQATSA